MHNVYGAYGLYKNVRNTAWQVLIDNNITQLPIDISFIARNNGVVILKNSEMHELKTDELGISVFKENQWYIIYDDSINNRGLKRFTIAHELGHIFLGHPLELGYHARKKIERKPQIETDADMFAARVLAPACVLWGLEVQTATEIEKLCDISHQAAAYRMERMKILYNRQKFLSNPTEKRLYNQFKNFIEEHR